MREKFTISSTKFTVKFSQWCWIIRVEYMIKCRSFKHVKNYLTFMKCNNWVCSDWTLGVVFTVRDGKLFRVYVVRKGAEKHVLTLK